MTDLLQSSQKCDIVGPFFGGDFPRTEGTLYAGTVSAQCLV